jgi:two-component system, NarL family, response regulator NreC
MTFVTVTGDRDQNGSAGEPGHADAGPRPSAPTPRSGPIRVALVEDHHLVREGLRLAIAAAEGFEIVGEADTRAGAMELVATTQPDVLLLDLTLPEGDALPLLDSLPAIRPGLRVIILTMHSDPETVRQALAAGASGYLVKGAHLEELFAAIRAVARGQRYLHSSVTENVVEDSIRWFRSGPLSAREREILRLVASGHPPMEIGRMLGISVHTVRRHVANISEKLGIRGNNALTRYAIRSGLVTDD